MRAALALAALLAATPALAHDWYTGTHDPVTGGGCCGGSDCAILKIEPGVLEAEDSGYRIRLTEEQARRINPSRIGAVDILVEWSRIQLSQDGNYHLCLPPHTSPAMRADFYCFFAPGST